jgi:biopolymer transport protein ExbB/TolQ
VGEQQGSRAVNASVVLGLVGMLITAVASLIAVALRLGAVLEKLRLLENRSESSVAMKEEIALLKQQRDQDRQAMNELKAALNLALDDIEKQGRQIDRLLVLVERLDKNSGPPRGAR